MQGELFPLSAQNLKPSKKLGFRFYTNKKPPRLRRPFESYLFISPVVPGPIPGFAHYPTQSFVLLCWTQWLTQ